MSRLDDELPSRLVGQETVILKWFQPWCCHRCKRDGVVLVQVTGGDRDPRTLLHNPRTGDGEFEERLDASHRKRSPFCIATSDELMKHLAGFVWRFGMRDGRVVPIYMDKPAFERDWRGRDNDGEKYKWPPWGVE